MKSTVDIKVTDVVILGGGLAGLSLALQLKKRLSSLKIIILEKRDGLAPIAAHKVGESSVEIGAHYLSKIIGIEDHIKQHQLPKLGLRFFFRHGENERIEDRMEVGEHRFFKTPSFQLDRGILENYLGDECERRGIQLLKGAKVKEALLPEGNSDGAVTWEELDERQQKFTVHARWIIDATGRNSFLKKKLGLRKNIEHDVNSVWFRVKGRIDIDSWSDDPGWSSRVEKEPRWLSTNHLMGKGYWVWIIPLSSGNTSIGIVAEEGLHPMTGYNTIDKAKSWLRKHEPQCEKMTRDHEVMDFIGLRKFSYSAKQVISENGWAMVGEAGRFLDPFYSPGSDYIGIGNTFVTELIIRERSGEKFTTQAQFFEKVFSQFFDIHLDIYAKQYRMFGEGIPMIVKIVWDFSYYWCIPAFLFFQDMLTDLKVYVQHQKNLEAIGKLNRTVQTGLRKAAKATTEDAASLYFEFHKVPFMSELNGRLSEELSAKEKELFFIRNVQFLQDLGDDIVKFSILWQKAPSVEGLKGENWKVMAPVLAQLGGC